MFTIIIDPKNMFSHKGVTDSYIFEKCDVVINWALNRTFGSCTLLDSIKQQYLYAWNPLLGGVVEEGVFKYPGDPALYPLLYIQRGASENNHLWFYDHDIIAIKHLHVYEIARID